jgi:hypothetical protein
MITKLIALTVSLAAALWADVEHRETKQLTFTLPANGKLIVDNVNGGIRVTAHSGRDVRVSIDQLWRADTSEELARARSEVKVEATQDANSVKLYVDGPSRCNCDRRNDYHARFNFEIAVPADAAFDLKTVNGSIDVQDTAGAGSARTVNGRIHVAFARNPNAPISFKTVNGEVAVELQPDVAADFRFKTLNGQAYTDFEVTSLPSEPVKLDRQPGKSVFRMNQFTGVRIGAGGGPEHRFETLNGNIRIVKRGK